MSFEYVDPRRTECIDQSRLGEQRRRFAGGRKPVLDGEGGDDRRLGLDDRGDLGVRHLIRRCVSQNIDSAVDDLDRVDSLLHVRNCEHVFRMCRVDECADGRKFE
ncbi:hypothetical protein [Rhodococcus erythropolis]|uniref:hypothetical protein n=1 Tax=Rhodococcus erythropolis TaxID=1833 RepID=UPI003D278AD3